MSTDCLLGIHSVGHDASACIWNGQNLTWAQESERITRVKHDSNVFASLDNALPRLVEQKFEVASSVPLKYSLFGAETAIDQRDMVSPSNLLVNRQVSLNGQEVQCHFVAHEAAHAAVGLHYAGYRDRCLVLVNEGRGHFSRNSLFLFANGKFSLVEHDSLPWYACGFGWSAVASLLGYSRSPSIAGTLMAMSAYGHQSDRYHTLIESIPDAIMEPGSKAQIEWQQRLSDTFIAFSFEEKAEFLNSLQRSFSEEILKYLQRMVERHNATTVALSGGCALNIVANSYLRDGLNVPVVPAPICNDAGQAIGASICTMLLRDGNSAEPFSIYMNGASLDRASDIEKLSLAGMKMSDATPEKIVEQLERGAVIAFMQGKAELGPRALGHRSLIASPQSPQMRKRVSETIKKREWFRPLAPVMRESAFRSTFPGFPTSPHMMFNFDIRELNAPACTHKDGTGRIQTLDPQENPVLDEVLRQFDQRTGVSCLINTSLNGPGKPICNDISDVLEDFGKERAIDYVVYEDVLVEFSKH